MDENEEASTHQVTFLCSSTQSLPYNVNPAAFLLTSSEANSAFLIHGSALSFQEQAILYLVLCAGNNHPAS